MGKDVECEAKNERRKELGVERGREKREKIKYKYNRNIKTNKKDKLNLPFYYSYCPYFFRLASFALHLPF